MNRYNAEHYKDITAAMAVMNADRDVKHGKRTKPWRENQQGMLTYRIGEVARLFVMRGRIYISKPIYECNPQRNNECSKSVLQK